MPPRRAVARRTVPNDGLEAGEAALVGQLSELRRLEMICDHRDARIAELRCTHAVQAALAVQAAERPACTSAGEAAQSASALRARVRNLTGRLDECEEELQWLRDSPKCTEALEARLRAAAAAERCEALAGELRRQPAKARAMLEHGLRDATLDHAALEERLAAEAAVHELRRAAEADELASMYGGLGALVDEADAVRGWLVELEASEAARREALRASRAAAAATAAESAAMQRSRLELLSRECGVLERSLDEDTRRRLTAEERVRREETKLRATIAAARAELARMSAAHDALSAGLSLSASTRREAGERCRRDDEAARAARPPARPASAAGGAARGAMDAAQKARLEELKGKYGSHVAGNMVKKQAAPRSRTSGGDSSA